MNEIQPQEHRDYKKEALSLRECSRIIHQRYCFGDIRDALHKNKEEN